MPNYSFVIDSTYNPFTMQEMVAPLAMYKDAFDKSEAAFEDLTDKADKFKYLSMTLPEGSKGRQIYENYSNELNKQAEDLARNGLSVNNRMALRNLRRRYQGEIGRLDLADQALQEERKLRRQMNAKDSSMLYAEDNLSIDNFLDGATPNLYNISGTELYTRGAAAGKAASSRMYSSGDEGSTLNGYYRKWTERYGYSKESMDAFRANASAIPELQQAAENILAERGALDNLSGANLERARQSVLNGIIDGAVSQVKVNPVEDKSKIIAAQEASQKRVAKYTAELQNRQRNSLAINPINIYNKKDADQAKTNMSRYAKYFTTYSNGKVVMNADGLKEYKRNAAPKVTVTGSGSGTAALMNSETQLQTDNNYQPTEFKKFIDSLGGSKYFKDGKMMPGNLGNLWVQYNKKNSTSKYDATRSTEFDYTISSSQQDEMKKAIQVAARGTKLEEVDFDNKTNAFKPTGTTIDASELNSEDIEVLSTRFSPYGNTMMVKDKNGEIHRYMMPTGINPTNENNRDKAMQKAMQWQNMIVSGQYKDANGNVHQATSDEITYAQMMYGQALQEAYLYHSQLGVSNKVKEQEFNPYGN